MADAQDPRTIVEYRRDGAAWRGLPLFLWLCAFGLLLAAAQPEVQLPAWVLVAAGAILAGFSIHRGARPGEPVLRLAPAAVSVALPWVQPFSIPWSELRGVETISFSVLSHRSGARYSNVTAILVSPDFLARHVDANPPFVRGWVWDHYFRPLNGQMGIVLNHVHFGTGPEAVRLPIEARWRAFGQGGAGRDAVGAPREVIRHGDMRDGDTSKAFVMAAAPLIVVLIILANLAGFWETSGQQRAREIRESIER